ncbi:transcriptional regulator, TetR family [Denitrovibrio acetiphilus DSM 12809]|jgi:AcrR family transcriptional regulator|uniref:Transcriptional regulator, TetR family n=1 Tax=Denitrovibrio acetiphilus (strain DSM 12809 / NBRC 114555 / N2460) TaxID=522772 RepID=D4H8B0_DENA2|nr:TetR/AcrR family transcriptional regulator [Denitrovibrio acetiphilus]ADD68259.1 transcriptional regulator, TetR family [Denitrovibrio acetiphilus DSM 12809]
MQTNRISRKEQDKIRHRNYILTAALELFSEKGYHSVSMQEVAAKAEFAIGTLYKFFKSKEELYKCLIMTKAHEYHDTLYEVLSEKKDVVSIISDYVSAKFRLFDANASALKLYIVGSSGTYYNIQTGFDHEIQSLYNKLLNHIAAVMESGISRNVINNTNPYFMALALEGITNTFLYNLLENLEQDYSETDISVITEMFLHGVLKK